MRIELSACMLVPHWSRVYWLSLEWLATRLVPTTAPDSSGQLTVQLSWSEVTSNTSYGNIRPSQGRTIYKKMADEQNCLPHWKNYLSFSSKVGNKQSLYYYFKALGP